MCHNVTNAPNDKIFLELRPAVNVKFTVALKQCVKLSHPKIYLHT